MGFIIMNPTAKFYILKNRALSRRKLFNGAVLLSFIGTWQGVKLLVDRPQRTGVKGKKRSIW